MVFLFILFICLCLTLVVLTSKLDISIINLIIDTQSKKRLNDRYEIIIRLKIFGNMPILKLTINENRLSKIQQSWKMTEKVKQLEKDILQNRNQFDIEAIKVLKEFSKNICIKHLNLRIEIGTENAFLTSILVAFFSSALAISFSRIHVKENNIVYKIEPVYRNENSIKIEISGIFQIKLIHIINTIYVLNKKGGRKKHERTSNRRSYDYSYE